MTSTWVIGNPITGVHPEFFTGRGWG